MNNDKVKIELDKIVKENPDFTGKCEVNYKNGRPRDLNVTIRKPLENK